MTETEQPGPRAWVYNPHAAGNQWSEKPDPVAGRLPRHDGETEGDWLTRAGFSVADQWPGPASLAAYEYTGRAGFPYRWRIHFGMNDAGAQVIMVTDFPALVDVLGKLAPIALVHQHQAVPLGTATLG